MVYLFSHAFTDELALPYDMTEETLSYIPLYPSY
jgi:hypothetical protein